jgi:hypothetical protein
VDDEWFGHLIREAYGPERKPILGSAEQISVGQSRQALAIDNLPRSDFLLGLL